MHGDAPQDWRSRVEEVVGPIRRTRALGESAFLVQAAQNDVVAKFGPGCPDEADGLRRLGLVPGAPPVPAVLVVDRDLLVTEAVELMPRHAGHDEELGRTLAVLHATPCDHWGGGSSWIGRCQVEATRWPDPVHFYAARLLELAQQCGLTPEVETVVGRLEALLPSGGAALLHGDLWWGNVLAGADGRSWLIDPSIHGGHGEEDLAMLALFGEISDRLLAAYQETLPLQAGWQDRIALFQLCPLLVHAVLFGGSYRARSQAVARRYA